MMKDNIILIGMPGAGKSTLGVVLAKMANYRFLDCDLLIQRQQGKTLQELIDELGPEGFIQMENEALKGISCQRTIIATGGSAVYSGEAMEHLGALGTVVNLRVGFDEMVQRLGDLGERGVVRPAGKQGDLRALYDERAPLYERYADVAIDVTDAQFRDAAIELKGVMKGRGLLDAPIGPRHVQVFRHWRDDDMVFNMERQISFDMIDCNRHLKPHEALRLLGDIANADFAELGFTHRSMIEQGFYFIVMRANVHKVREPLDEERVTMRTWPHAVKGMQVARNFEMLDAQGAPILQAELVYLIIDAKAGRPIRIMNFPLMQMYQVEREVQVEKRQRVRLADDMREIARTQPRFSDLDVNGHVTNTHYPMFAHDFLPDEVRSRAWSDFQVEYTNEIHAGEDIVLFANDSAAAVEAGGWVSMVGAQADGTTNFSCSFKFE